MNFRYDKDEEKLVVSSATRIEYHQMKIWLTRKVKGYRYMPAFKMGIWSGDQSYFDNGKVNLGLWKECYKGCKEIGVTFNIENRDEFPLNRDVTLESVKEFCQDFFKSHKIKDKEGNWIPFMPYDYQIETAYKILKNRYCLASVATSGGKSLIISIVYFYTLKNINPDAKLLIIVPSITLVSQFYDDIKKYFYGENNINNIYDYKIQIEMEDGSILCKNPNDIVITKNRGDIKAKDLNTNDLDNTKQIIKIKTGEPIRIEEIMSERPRKPINEDPNVFIGTYQSLVKYPKKFFEQFHTVSVDECLHPNTKILMSDNTYKEISKIEIGEFVKTINESTKEVEDKKVEYVYKNLSKNENMYEIELENGKIIRITGNHKVLCSDFKWKKVEDLKIDDDIIDINF